jgi:nitroreductase
MDLKALLTDRRAVRDYQDKNVPLSIVKEILQDTCLAPTARNGQPCRFIIIQDRNLMKRLSDESKANLLADAVKNPALLSPDYEAILRDENFNVFYNAPCLVLFIGSNDVESLDVDVALTVAYSMFSATAKGLGTCWIGLGAHIRDSLMLKEIGVPNDCRIVAPIIVGYPVSIPPASERHAPDIVKVL